MDFKFIEFYVRNKYNINLNEYFNLSKQTVSNYRLRDYLPTKHIETFYTKEGMENGVTKFDIITKHLMINNDRTVNVNDIAFLDYYIDNKYEQKLYQYFNILEHIVYNWRRKGEITSKELINFILKEKTTNYLELFNQIS